MSNSSDINAERAPFPVESFGTRAGRGKDNMVRYLPLVDRPADFVVKYNHDNRGERSTEQVFRATQYKKEKYEILKMFLGDFIPETSFAVGTKKEYNGRERAVEYVVQQRLPKRTMNSLTPEQQQDPRLVANMQLLMVKMENMYRAIGNINARMGSEPMASLDAKLDLGGISGYVREHIEEEITPETAQETIYRKGDTPNILVDPETMNIYCVDFDEGTWTKERAIAKANLINYVESDQATRDIIGMQTSDLGYVA